MTDKTVRKQAVFVADANLVVARMAGREAAGGHSKEPTNVQPGTKGFVSSPSLVRFLDKVMPEPNSGCWLWLGCLHRNGYGQFWNGKKIIPAHRFSYGQFVSPIEDWPATLLDHKCRNRMCVNPAHLRIATLEENARNSDSTHAVKTHCPTGHPYSPENTYRYPNGHRKCRECKRIRDRRYYRQARSFLEARKP